MSDAKSTDETSSKKKLIAKKDWHLVCGGWDPKTNKSEHDYKIKKGDVVKVPEKFHATLKKEEVI